MDQDRFNKLTKAFIGKKLQRDIGDQDELKESTKEYFQRKTGVDETNDEIIDIPTEFQAAVSQFSQEKGYETTTLNHNEMEGLWETLLIKQFQVHPKLVKRIKRPGNFLAFIANEGLQEYFFLAYEENHDPKIYKIRIPIEWR